MNKKNNNELLDRKKSLSVLNKLFELKTENEDDTIIPEKDREGFCDRGGVFMIIPKTVYARSFLVENFVVGEGVIIASLSYAVSDMDKDNVCSSLFSVEYLSIILDLIKVVGGSVVRFKVREDYPLTVETKHYVMVLAQRIDNGEGF